MESEEKLYVEIYRKMALVCSHSEQCSPDIRKKIIALGGNSILQEQILEKLEKEKFVDDRRYIKAYISDKFKINKWGRIKLRYYLKMKGLAEKLIDEGLSGIDSDKYKDALLKTMNEKARLVKNKPKFEKMGQIIRFAQSRGFEPELIHRYLNEVAE
jgi:regulatory protein